MSSSFVKLKNKFKFVELNKTKRTGRGSQSLATAPGLFVGAVSCVLSRGRTSILRGKVIILCRLISPPGKPRHTRAFPLLLRDSCRCFRLRSAACLRCMRFRQSGQYLTLFELETKDASHTAHRRLSSGA